MKDPPKQNKGFRKPHRIMCAKLFISVLLILSGVRTFNHIDPWLGIFIFTVGVGYLIKTITKSISNENL